MGLSSLISLSGWAVLTAAVSARYKDNLNKITSRFFLAEANGSQQVFLPALAYRLREQGLALRSSDKACENPIEVVWIKGCSLDSDVAK